MKGLPFTTRTLALIGVALPFLAGFAYVASSAGPLAPVAVTVATVEQRAVVPALFGIGTVESRYTYRIGPTAAGRVRRVEVQVGDRVEAGRLLAEMDPVDLDDRVAAQDAALRRAESAMAAAAAQLEEAAARMVYAKSQARRYERLFEAKSVGAEAVEARRQENRIAAAGAEAARSSLEVARQDLVRARAEHEGLLRQRANLRLVAPVDGLVVARNAEPGTTVVAGQAVVEVIDPAGLWVNVRFDQSRAEGLRSGLPASVQLRSRGRTPLTGRVARLEPLADAVTEEILAKVVFDAPPEPLPPIGELAEVTVSLPAVAAAAAVPNAALRRVDGKTGVWQVEAGELRFAPVKLDASDLEGWVQVGGGLGEGDRVVVYSQRAIDAGSRIEVVDRLVESAP